MTENHQANTQAHDFILPNGDGQLVDLNNYRGKNVVLAFYPADWSPVCTNELTLFQETLDDIHGYNAEILGISVDGKYSHRAWAEQKHLTFPLLSDFWPHGAVAQQYSVFDLHTGLCKRALFFIDPSGVIHDTWVAEDPEIAPGLNIVFKSLEHMQEAHHAV